MAPITLMAFSKACFVRICDRHWSSRTISTIRRPDIRASRARRASTAGQAALPGKVIPSASTIDAMVEAVPIVMQWPGERDIALSASANSAPVISPARTASENFQTSVPEPMALPR